MAVAPTGNIFKALSFDNVSSRTYGVYITGEAVYNAPGRDVEMVEIPGRNGSFALDKGRFQNIEVSYPAGIFADNETDFAEAISDFRNFLCSRRGYVRLTDEYNPNEYRMAIYKSGLEVSPAQLKAGEFNIVFDCKPQRWLTSGEAAVDVSDGDTLLNPTLFESSPLLAVEGYGTIGFNGYVIELENNVVGEIVLADSTTTPLTSFNVNYNTDLLDDGDDIIIGDIVINAQIYLGASGSVSSLTDSNNEFTSVGTNNGNYYITTTLPSFTRAKGTAYTYKANTVTVSGTDYSGNSSSATCLIRIYAYDDRVSISLQKTTVSGKFFYNTRSTTVNRIIGDSTMTTLGHPTYIDCDYGEAYKVDGDTIVSLNAYIDLGSDLPKLASGANTIAYDNTITELKIIPRWWKV